MVLFSNIKKNQNFVFLHTFYSIFLFKVIFLAYECTFISANHIINNIGCLGQTGKNAVILMKSNFYKLSKNARKWNFMKKKK